MANVPSRERISEILQELNLVPSSLSQNSGSHWMQRCVFTIKADQLLTLLQLRGLIMLYLTIEKGGASTGKTQIPSINEVLKMGKVIRDKGWVGSKHGYSQVFHLTLPSSKTSASVIPTLSRRTGLTRHTKRNSRVF